MKEEAMYFLRRLAEDVAVLAMLSLPLWIERTRK